MPALKYLPDVVTLELDTARCSGCGICVEVCPHAVFVITDRLARIVDRDGCMECGACALNCPSQALTVRSGVGCAAAMILGALRGTEPVCGCSGAPDPGQSSNTGCCG